MHKINHATKSVMTQNQSPKVLNWTVQFDGTITQPIPTQPLLTYGHDHTASQLFKSEYLANHNLYRVGSYIKSTQLEFPNLSSLLDHNHAPSQLFKY